MLGLNNNKICCIYFSLLFLLLCSAIQAADINIKISQKSINNSITIYVTNQSRQVLQLAKIRLTLNQQIYWLATPESLQENESKQYIFTILYPKIPGSYAQIVSVFYYNEGHLFSLNDVGYFNYQTVKHFDADAALGSTKENQQVSLNLSAKHPELWSFVIPDEVTAKTSSQLESVQLLLTGNYTGFNSNYPIFAIKELTINKLHSAKILRIMVTIKHNNKKYPRGKTSNLILSAICLLSLLVFLFFRTKMAVDKESHLLFLLFFSRLFFLSISYLLLKNANNWLSFSSLLDEHFSGNNYRYFFLYFIDIYFWSFIILYLPYLKYFEFPLSNKKKADNKPEIIEDKYIVVLSWLLNPIINKPLKPFILSKQQLQSPLKTGWLLIAVKFFFLPLLASWVIGNFIHQWNLLEHFNWTFHQINAFILALLILTDTSIFLVGYLFESSLLGSKVRSVEPTIFGWVVCLWCYPPFNTFSFAAFDINFINIHVPIAAWAEPVVLVFITLFWGIFVWASLALGFKASNLTNRGIVIKGPYRYCRHPAYTAKIAVWMIEAVFLGKYFIGLFIGFLVIYLLRTLTEERHLSLDADYQEYKKKVPYRFIPGIL